MAEPSEKITIITEAEIEAQVVEAGKRYRNFLAEADELGATLRADDVLRISRLAEEAEKATLVELTAQRAKAVAAAGSLSVAEATEEEAPTPAEEMVRYSEKVTAALKRSAISAAFPTKGGVEVVRNKHEQTIADRLAPNPLMLGNIAKGVLQPLEGANKALETLNESDSRHTEVVVVGYQNPFDTKATFGKLTGATGDHGQERAVIIDYAGRGPLGPVQMSITAGESDAMTIARAIGRQPQMPGHFMNGFVSRRLGAAQVDDWKAARPQPEQDATMFVDFMDVGGIDKAYTFRPYLPEQPQPEA